MKIIGLDFGTKYIGISISDMHQKMAFPRGKAEQNKLIPDLKKLILEEDVELVVLGKPTNLKGQNTAMTNQVEEFKANLEKQISVPVRFYDERLTSKIVDRSLASMNVNTRKRKELKDTLEATQILQSYLDQKNVQK